MLSLPRTRFNSPQLIRLLADLAIDEVADSKPSKQSFAERLAQWLDLTDAIALSGTLNARAGSAPAARSQAAGTAQEEELAFARLRTALVDSITADGVFRPGKARIKLPAPPPGATLETAVDFAPYRRYYAAHQRDMASRIGPLRVSLRAALAKRSPTLAQLAALDAVLDKALGERERSLLATVPQLLEKRFGHLRRAHAQALAETRQADDPAQWTQPGGWLAVFCQGMQGVLLAELEVRLQPVAGLVDAFSNEVRSSNE